MGQNVGQNVEQNVEQNVGQNVEQNVEQNVAQNERPRSAMSIISRGEGLGRGYQVLRVNGLAHAAFR